MPARRRNRIGRLVKDLVVVVLVALLIAFLLKQFLVQPFAIPSGSMQDTLKDGDRVLVSKLVPDVFDVDRGDIVVFKDPGDWLEPLPPVGRGAFGNVLHGFLEGIGLAPPDKDQFLIKRVIGLGGDTVECEVTGVGRPGVLSVNGTELTEPYLAEGTLPCTEKLTVTVPDNALWVMGDNRQGSMDSRYHRDGRLDGAVDLDLVVGVAKVLLPPMSEMSRFGVLRNPGTTFSEVLDPEWVDLV